MKHPKALASKRALALAEKKYPFLDMGDEFPDSFFEDSDDDLEAAAKGKRVQQWKSDKQSKQVDVGTLTFIPVANDTATWLRKRGKAVRPQLTL